MANQPDFFVIGAMKAGTTSLYDYLDRHPDIFMCRPKEPGYFSQPDVFIKGDEWYRSLFSAAQDHQLKGDASTCYSRWPTYQEVPARIYQMSPKAKFIYMVRDPIKRAYSHYGHRMQEHRSEGKDIITFKQAIDADNEMLTAGQYSLQLDKFLEFYPLESFLIIRFEDFITDPKAVVSKVFRFLEVSAEQFEWNEEIASNQQGDAYAKQTFENKLNTIRHLPLLTQLKRLIPRHYKKRVMSFIRQSLQRSWLSQHLAKKHAENISAMDEQDIALLSEYYKDDAQAFYQLTGVQVLS